MSEGTTSSIDTTGMAYDAWESRQAPWVPPTRSRELGKIFAALAKAQGMMRGAVKDKENPFYKSGYADLASVVEAVREPLATNEICFYHELGDSDGTGVTVTCILGHSSGQWLSSTVTIKPAKADAQGIGGAQTYGRRYTLVAITGLPQVDDDGNTASGASDKKPPKQLDDLTQDIARQMGGREVDPNTRKLANKAPANKAPANKGPANKGPTSKAPTKKAPAKKTNDSSAKARVINKEQVDALWAKAEQMTGGKGQRIAAPVVKFLLQRHELKKTADIPVALYEGIMQELADMDPPDMSSAQG